VKRQLGHGTFPYLPSQGFLYLPSQGWATCPPFVFGTPGRASPLYLRSEPPCRSDVSKADSLVGQTRPRGATKLGDHLSRQAVSVVRPRPEVVEFPWRFHLGESHLGDGELVLGRARLLQRASGSRSKPMSSDGMSRSAAASAQQIHHEAGTPDNAVKLPGPDDPITIERNPNRVVVSWQAAS
jgi:hypothetical protein